MALWGLRDAFALTGTANVSNLVATTTVTGTGTAFDTELDLGDTIIIDGKKRKVVAITSNVSITIDPAWDGANVTDGFVEGQDSPKYVLASEVSGNNILGVSQTEALVSTNQANGLYTPGWVSHSRYTDMHGNLRYKTESLVSISTLTSDAANTIDAEYLPNS